MTTDVLISALADAEAGRDKLEAMRSRFAPGQTEADKPLDDYDLKLLGSAVVQVRLNMALAPRDVIHQLRALRRSAESAIAILEQREGTSAGRRILAKRAMEAARDTIRETRMAAGDDRTK